MNRRIVALNGWPKSGKSEVADILVREFGAVIVDDGEILRKAAPILFHGVELEDCYTQDGKTKMVVVNGQTFTVRQCLGYLGQVLENFFGEDYIPDQTLRRIAEMPPAKYYVLPSVRKGQGWLYRAHGAKVFQMLRDVEPSLNPFDVWDEEPVHDTIDNRGSLEDLSREVRRVMFKEFLDPGFTRIVMAS